MTMKSARSRRRGNILPLTALMMVGLCGFVALAVDVGTVAVAKTQAQDAADAAALSATRSIDGSTSPNLTLATTNANTTAAANPVLSKALTSAEITVTYGSYHYDTTSQTFDPQYPPVAPDNYNLANVTVTHQINTSFARVLGITTASISATATAAHRPRDVSIILDYSGSMNNESDTWNCET
ncbi:MAG TPA: pilus assembly protein TadG-related protein, partial [Isosphaeraceae bacterium]|nr:pilus assembly protein TadG-related protein [Isosphaeraceae bacterium]